MRRFTSFVSCQITPIKKEIGGEAMKKFDYIASRTLKFWASARVGKIGHTAEYNMDGQPSVRYFKQLQL